MLQDELLRAKITPPDHRIKIGKFCSIADQFERMRQHPYTVVEAPAGFGKTTVISEWYQKLGLDHPAAWLGLDEKDDNISFLKYLTFSIEQTGILKPDCFLSERLNTPEDIVQQIVMLLIAIEKCSGPVFLFLDDVDQIQDQSATNLLDQIISRAPHNLHLIMSWRSNPSLSLSALEMRGLVCRITAQQLRFSPQEIHEFFGNTLAHKDLDCLYEKTEGWPVAVHFFKKIYEKSHNFDSVDPILKQSRLFSNYVAERFFQALTSEEQDILLRISVLEWIDSGTITDLTEDHVATLEFLESSQLSGLISEQGKQNYRLHSLLREFLVTMLRSSFPELYARQNKLAALSIIKSKHWNRAALHARQAQDLDLFSQIYDEMGGLNIWITEGFMRLAQIIELAPDEAKIKYPRIGLAQCIVHIKRAELAEAFDLYQRLSALPELFGGEEVDNVQDSSFLEYVIVQSALTVYGCLPLKQRLIDELMPKAFLKESSPPVLAYYKNILCVINAQNAHFDDAKKYVHEANGHYEQIGSKYGTLYLNIHLANILFAEGQSEEAGEKLVRAYNLYRNHFPKDLGIKLVLNVFQSELGLERGNYDLVQAKHKNILKHLHKAEAWFDVYAAAYSTICEYIHQTESAAASLYILEQAFQQSGKGKIEKLGNFLAALKISILICNGDLEQASALSDQHPIISNLPSRTDFEALTWREHELFHECAIGLLAQSGEVDKALTLCDQYLERCHHAGLMRSITRILPVKAIAQWTNDQVDQTDKTMTEAFSAISSTGLEHAAIRATRLFRSSHLPKTSELAGIHAESYPGIALFEGCVTQYRQDALQCSLFSHKETQILTFLEEGLQDKMIARKLGVSHHTVRYHLKNIYAKLGAHGRHQAVIMAQQLIGKETQSDIIPQP